VITETLTEAVSDDLVGLVLKLLAAIVAGLVLGYDREVKGHAAGLRTHALVALASAATAALALELHAELLREHPNSSADPLRIVEGLVAAVGFLGGGIIIRSGGQIRGLTTAANLWACGIIGLAFGSGLWRIGLLTLVLAFVVLVLLHAVERRWFPEDRSAED
jgi:putative Mg2+ transporter-C (MgtC) family protein